MCTVYFTHVRYEFCAINASEKMAKSDAKKEREKDGRLNEFQCPIPCFSESMRKRTYAITYTEGGTSENS